MTIQPRKMKKTKRMTISQKKTMKKEKTNQKKAQMSCLQKTKAYPITTAT